MRTIFRSFNMGLILASILALGAVTGFAQDPCTDAAGQAAASDNITTLFQKRKEGEGFSALVEAAKQFLEKYGNCESSKPMKNYILGDPDATDPKLKAPKLPVWEASAREQKMAAVRGPLVSRFDTALNAKNLDEVYAGGKDILAKFPEDFRTVEIVLATAGGEEAMKNNPKYAADALNYAKMAIADLEANKSFNVGDTPRYGLSLKDKAGKYVYNYEFNNKADALAWMNTYAGYITAITQKNKQAALPYLYKATQASGTDAAKFATTYEIIGGYYFDELNKVIEQIQAKTKEQKDTDTPEVAQAKVDELKKLVAQSNGISERAMDAFARAYTFAPATDPTYKARMKKNVDDAYFRRFGKNEGVDTWISSAIAKPLVNPTTPIAPISDPEPVKTEAAATTPVSNVTTTTTTTVKPATTPAKPAAPAPKPATKPSGAKVAVLKKTA